MKWLYGLDTEVGEEPTSEADEDNEPEMDNVGDFSYGNFHLVGHGNVTNAHCGKWRGHWGCSRVELHNRMTLDGQNFRGKVYMRKVFYSCDKPSCPLCFKYGWAVRQKGRIEDRLNEASKKYGQVEHIIVSVPSYDYGANFNVLRAKVVRIVSRIGVIGGVLIFHGFRFNDKKLIWHWSPHWHILGFILGGYSRCRHCQRKKARLCDPKCDGFYSLAWKTFQKYRYYVKVKGKRKAIGGTAWYQLGHSSIDVTKKRFHVATWFGVVSYRKMKLKIVRKKRVCPLCQHELRQHYYHGCVQSILDSYKTLGHKCKKRDFYYDLEENGERVWIEKVQKGYVPIEEVVLLGG